MSDMTLDEVGLGELVERVKAANGPDREIGIDLLIRFDPFYGKAASRSDGISAMLILNADPTASIDAALALVERVLPGWWVQHLGKVTTGWACRIETQGISIPKTTRPLYAPTAPLAILLALLSALSINSKDGEP